MPIPKKIQTAIDALEAISLDDIKALDDDALTAFDRAICGPATYTDVQCDIRRWWRRDAAEIRDNTDTDWPDAIEETAA